MFFFYCSLRPNPPVLLSSPACRHGCGGMSRPQHFSVLAPLCYCNTRVTNTDCLMNRPVLTWMAVSIHSLHTTKLNRGIMLNSTAKKWSHWKFGTTHCTQKTKVVTLKIWLSVCTAGHTCIFLRVRVCVYACVCVHAHARLHATLCNPMDCSPRDSSVNHKSPAWPQRMICCC